MTSTAADSVTRWLYRQIENEACKDSSIFKEIGVYYDRGMIEIGFYDTSIVHIDITGMEPPCPHCTHDFKANHEDQLCFRCKKYHTVCRQCEDLGICFMESMEDVTLGQRQEKQEG